MRVTFHGDIRYEPDDIPVAISTKKLKPVLNKRSEKRKHFMALYLTKPTRYQKTRDAFYYRWRQTTTRPFG